MARIRKCNRDEDPNFFTGRNRRMNSRKRLKDDIDY